MVLAHQADKKTVVVGVRAEQEFFDKCNEIAKAKGMTRNQYIVFAVKKHMKGVRLGKEEK